MICAQRLNMNWASLYNWPLSTQFVIQGRTAGGADAPQNFVKFLGKMAARRKCCIVGEIPRLRPCNYPIIICISNAIISICIRTTIFSNDFAWFHSFYSCNISLHCFHSYWSLNEIHFRYHLARIYHHNGNIDIRDSEGCGTPLLLIRMLSEATCRVTGRVFTFLLNITSLGFNLLFYRITSRLNFQYFNNHEEFIINTFLWIFI